MTTFILVIAAISILILVHEWGHFYSARRFGVKVEEFGFGFPPRVFAFVKNGIRYSFNLLPLGGFVKIFGEHGEGEDSRESFSARPAWQRFVMLGAGIGMNFALAWVFFTGGALVGIPALADDDSKVPVSILAIIPGSPADAAGLKLGDEIVAMREAEVSLLVERERDIQDFVAAYRGEEITIVVRRAGELTEIVAVPRAQYPEGEGPLGIALGRIEIQQTTWYRAPVEGFFMLARSTAAVVEGLGGLAYELFRTGSVAAEVAGPVGIFFFADDVRSLGVAYFLQFLGILSVNLAVLNFLPIPALDGGRIAFIVLEKIRRKRMNPAVENAAHAVGFALLILLMVAVTYRDIARIL